MTSSYPPFTIGPPRISWRRTALSSVLTIAGVLTAALLLNLFVFQSYYVDGESMSPNLHDNDRLIVSKLERTASSLTRDDYLPERGHIVIIDGAFRGATTAGAEQLIKRVVALPGDTVEIQDGRVTIYNRDAPQGFAIDQALGLSVEPTFAPAPIRVTIPERSVFVLGDNRGEGGSYDSRAFGPVPSEHLVGRLWARIMPLNQAHVY